MRLGRGGGRSSEGEGQQGKLAVDHRESVVC